MMRLPSLSVCALSYRFHAFFVVGGGSVGSNPLFVIDGDSLIFRFGVFEIPP